MTAVAVVGLGAMGSRMARRLLDAGHDVTVWNRTASKAEPLVAAGASAATTPADAARGAEVVVTMVTDAAALGAVTEGSGGVLDGIGDGTGDGTGTAVVDMSTVGPAAVARLRAVAPSTVDVLDAPVLGSVAEAEAGTLKIFVGGDTALFERWSGLLSALGTPLHVGPLGAGAAAKLVANATLFGVLGVLGEAFALGRTLGLADGKLFDVLDQTPLAAQGRRRQPAIETGEYPARFALALARKDADLLTEAASSAALDVRVVAAARSWFTDAEAAGMGGQDYSAVLALILGAR